MCLQTANMTTLVPRSAYTAEEITELYPPGVVLQQVQIVCQIQLIVSKW
jgi:hypothetical protein